MDSWVVACVLFGALLHASWNALVKSSGDQQADLALVHACGALVAVPLLAFTGFPPAAAWPFLLSSLAIHMAYYITLNGAYQHGELSLTYPIMRGSAPLLVALASGLVLGESLQPMAWAGILAVTAGVLMVGLARGADPWHHRRALGYALANAAVIACYTLVDGHGVRQAAAAGSTALAYVVMLFVLDGLPYPAWVWWRRTPAERQGLARYARQRWPLATLGGLASLGSYGIALWAMTRAPVAVVSALRETSVLFATLLSVLVLKERFTLRRAAGAGVIVGGVVALRLS
ncbi:MAG: EamA family transporter [Rubrivivax sp.]|nr:EamA family transporter [Rubrivivax sp.]